MDDALTIISNRIINAVPLEKLYLFGSYAAGTANQDSDFDFYMVMPNNGMRPLDAINTAYIDLK